MKDFLNHQMVRQLGFERHRTAWLESERDWREDRERCVHGLVNKIQNDDEQIWTGQIPTDEIWRGQIPTDDHAETVQNGYKAINVFLGEDVDLETSYMRNSQAFWNVEANSVREQADSMTAQSEQDQIGLSANERRQYDVELQTVFRGLRAGFEEQRTDACQNEKQVVQDLSKHHDKVRWRHMQSMMSEETEEEDAHDEDEYDEWGENEEAASHLQPDEAESTDEDVLPGIDRMEPDSEQDPAEPVVEP